MEDRPRGSPSPHDRTEPVHGGAEAPTLAVGSSEGPVQATGPAPGTKVGRFTITATLGGGGMGVVVEALDPTLDRKVALKLLRPDAARGDEPRERLLREARAMAKLSHPNVLTVHEAGVVGAQLYLAVELATGGTLRTWQETHPARPALIARYLDAARGLAAAHDAGLVHRDFKPDNVLLTGDGRVRVADFGLVGAEASAVADGDDELSSSSSFGHALTRAGALLGTPGYMAPEQHRGEVATAAADQYAFCVSLWEALQGKRPFTGKSLNELADRKQRGELPGTPQPPWLHAVLARGLAPSPAARWPSMHELIAAIERGPGPTRRTWVIPVIAAAAAFAALIVAMIIVRRDDGDRRSASVVPAGPVLPRPCQGADAALAGVWDDARKATLDAVFTATGHPRAADSTRRVAALVDRYTAKWVEARTDACEATRVRGEQSEHLMDLRMACLGRRLASLEALLAVFATADRGVVDRAVEAAEHFAPLESCADMTALMATVPPPDDPAIRARVEEIAAKITESQAQRTAGKLDRALELAAGAAGDAAATGHAATHAAALFERGVIEDLMGHPDQAVATQREAISLAASARDGSVELRAWSALLMSTIKLGEIKAADDIEQQATLALARGGALPLEEAGLASNRAFLRFQQNRLEDARAALERARVLYVQVRGADSLDVAITMQRMASVLDALGEDEQARTDLVRVLEIYRDRLGEDHPLIPRTMLGLGEVLVDQGRHAEAEALIADALARSTKALGADHPETAETELSLGGAQAAQGKHDEARAHLEHALATFEARFGKVHPLIGAACLELGAVLLDLGRRADAKAMLTRAHAVNLEVHGPDHPATVKAKSLLSTLRPSR